MEAGFYETTRHDDIIAVVDSSSVGFGYLGPPGAGYCWYVRRLSTWSSSSGTPTCEVYVLSQPQLPANADNVRRRRVDYSTAGKNDIADEQAPIYVGEQEYLCVQWLSGSAADRCTLAVQFDVHQLSPVMVNPPDAAQLGEWASTFEDGTGMIVPQPVFVADDEA